MINHEQIQSLMAEMSILLENHTTSGNVGFLQWNPGLQTHLESNSVEAGEFEDRYGAQGFGNSVYVKDPEGNVVELRSLLPVDKKSI